MLKNATGPTLAFFMLVANGCGATAAAPSAAVADAVTGDDLAASDVTAVSAAKDAMTSDTETAEAPDATPAGTDATPAGTDATPPDAAPADAAAIGDPTVEKTTKSGSYTISVTGPTTIASGKKASYKVTVTDASGNPVPGLSLKVKFIHTQMGHGGSGVPKATDSGDGTYDVTGIVPTMAGLWALQISVGTDMAQFDIVVK